MEGTIVRFMWKYAMLLTLALGAGVLWGCNHQTNGNQAGAAEVAATGTGFEVGDVAPSFSLEKVQGGQLELDDLRGEVVLLDFWDTWCPPCRKALPHLQEISVEHQEGFVVVGVALGQEGSAKVKSFINNRGFTFPFVYGNVDIFQKFGVQSLPTTFLLGTDGVIQKKWIGGYPKEAYAKEVVKLLAG